MEQSIEELVRKVMAGDDEAVTDLYSATSHRAFYLARRLMGDDDLAEDVLQDAYVKALTNMRQLKDPSCFQAWLDTIVVNTGKNYLKKQQPELFSQLNSGDEDDDSEGITDIEDESGHFSPEASVDYAETKRLVQGMIDKLPEEQRMAILLYYMEDCPVKEIAKIMGCSEGTVKSRLNYGRKQLKKEAEDMEKKGVKLYCAPLIPFLVWMFAQDAYGAAAEGTAAVAALNTGSIGYLAAADAASLEAALAIEPALTGAGVLAVKAAEKGASHLVRNGIIGLVTAATVSFGVYEGYEALQPKPGPEATVESLEKALTAMDYDGIMECLDPSVQSLINGMSGMMGFVSSAMGFDIDVASALPGLIEFASLANGTVWPTFELEVLDITYTNEDSTEASVTVSIGGYTLDGQVLEPEVEVFKMKMIDDTWYIEVE